VRGFSRRRWRSKICTGPIRQRWMCCAALPGPVRWRRCSSRRPPGLSSDRLGACARITRPSRWRRSIVRGTRHDSEAVGPPCSDARGGGQYGRAHRRRAAVRRGNRNGRLLGNSQRRVSGQATGKPPRGTADRPVLRTGNAARKAMATSALTPMAILTLIRWNRIGARSMAVNLCPGLPP